MKLYSFQGDPRSLGREYGKMLAGQVLKNLSILIWREGYEPLPRTDADFLAWVKTQEEIIGKNWPWLLEETHGVAEGAGVSYDDILLLNLRAWQYNVYGAPPVQSCSSLAVTLADGTVACAGALDDTVDYYCGPVRFIPEKGFRFITFPITGTGWGNRGINSAGLTLGESSQLLPGLNRKPDTINQDLAVWVILQTCATVDEVREFCRKYPFTLNLICTDVRGGVFCAHQTAAGLLETATETPCALTNHVIDDRLMYRLNQQGVTTFRESPTTRLRRGKLLDFAYRQNGKCTAEEVRALIADHEEGEPSAICPAGNIALTYANPQAEPGRFWIAQPRVTGNEEWVEFNV